MDVIGSIMNRERGTEGEAWHFVCLSQLILISLEVFDVPSSV